MNEIRLDVEDLDRFFAGARNMANRLDRANAPSREAARLSLETMETLLKVITPNRWVLLRSLRSMGPSSIRGLAKVLGRDYRGVHADVRALREAGLIERDADDRVSVPWSRIVAEMSLDIAA